MVFTVVCLMLSISLSSLGPFFSAIMPAFTQLEPPHCLQLSLNTTRVLLLLLLRMQDDNVLA